jgi:hypothetical protein
MLHARGTCHALHSPFMSGRKAMSMKQIKLLACFLVLGLMSSCGQAFTPAATAWPASPATPPQVDAAQGSRVSPTALQSSTPVIQPFTTATLTRAPSYLPPATQPDEHLYLDPGGWYALSIPAGWGQADGSGPYLGPDGFFETGYLPEMRFVPRVLDVCQWLANITTKDRYAVSWLGTHKPGCQLISLPGADPATVLEVIENPSADFAQRFLYLKADAAHFGRFANAFTWLHPVDESAKPAFHTAGLRPEDSAFWENATPLPPTITVTEYELPPEAQQEDPGSTIFLEFIPPEARPTPRPPGVTHTSTTRESLNQTLSRYGYELRDGAQGGLYNLYKHGTLALENIYRLPDVYLFPTSGGEELVFTAFAVKDPNQPFYAQDNGASYLIRNETISLWEEGPVNPMYAGGRPILADGKLLILGLGDRTNVQVRDDRHNLVFSFETYFGTHIPIEYFQAWEQHWILEVSDFVVQDGEILNAQFGFEEVFDWHLIDGHPFYFFRKGPRVGISYNNQFFSAYYHEIIHGYCCGLALNNPMGYEHTVRFFGKRDGLWYYVVVEIK